MNMQPLKIHDSTLVIATKPKFIARQVISTISKLQIENIALFCVSLLH